MTWPRGYGIAWVLLVAATFAWFWYRGVQGGDVAIEIADALPALMFLALGPALFCGYPVAFMLGGIALVAGLAGQALDVFRMQQFFNVPSRIFGGVAANSLLQARLREEGEKRGLTVSFPTRDLCTDNAGMIAAVGHSRLARGENDGLMLDTCAREPLAR